MAFPATPATAYASKAPVAAASNEQGACPGRLLRHRLNLRPSGWRARQGVRTYRLVYRTVSATGRPTTASGLLAVPVNTAHRLSVVSLLRYPSGGLATELRIDDSVCDWAPAAPARLYLATRDEQAVNANTWHCQADFAAKGGHVPVVNLGTPDYQHSRHPGSNVAATAGIVCWFSALAR